MAGSIASELLKNCRTLAIVGLSRDPSKDSRIAANHLLSLGYEIIPVNPYAKTIAGMRCYSSLSVLQSEIAASIELIIIFRPLRGISPVINESKKLKQRYGRLKGVWLEPDMTMERSSSLDKPKDLTVIEGTPLLSELERFSRRKNE